MSLSAFFSPVLHTKVTTPFPTISTHETSPNFTFPLVFRLKLENNSLFPSCDCSLHYPNTKHLHCLFRYEDSSESHFLHSRTPLHVHRGCQPLMSRLGWFLDSSLVSRDRLLHSDPACHISNISPLNDLSSSFCLRCVTHGLVV